MYEEWGIQKDAMDREFLLFRPDSDLVGIEITARSRNETTKGCLMFTRPQLVALLAYMDDAENYYTGKRVEHECAKRIDNTE